MMYNPEQIKLDELIRAIEQSSYTQDEIIAFIKSLELKPEPMEEIVQIHVAQQPRRRRGRPRKNYETRDMTAGE